MIKPSMAMFTTDPTKELGVFEEQLEKKATGELDKLQNKIDAGIDSIAAKGMEALGELTGFLPEGLLDFKSERCINVPEFDIRFDLSLPDLAIGQLDLPCGLDTKINEMLADIEDDFKKKPFVKDLKGEYLDFIPGIDGMEVKVQQQAVKAFTNSSKVKEIPDDNMATATAGGLIRQSTRMGLHENVAILFEEAPASVDKELLNSYLLGSMRRALDAGALDTINACTDITGGDALLTVYPDAIEAILRGYTISPRLSEDEYLEEAEKLIDCLNRIYSSWDRYQSLPTYNDSGNISGFKCDTNTVKPFVNIGKDAKKLLEIHPRTMIPISLLSTVQSMAIQSAVTLYYPHAAV